MAVRDPVYLDTSALVKLLIHEPESDALIRFIDESQSQMVTSLIARVELTRAVSRVDDTLDSDISNLLSKQVLLPLTHSIMLRAAYLQPFGIRSLDAIHLATAIEIHPYLASLLSYDNRMVDGARSFGLVAEAPGL